MPTRNNRWLKPGEALYRLLGRIPVARIISRRSVKLPALRQDRGERFLPGGDKSITSDQDAVVIAEERYVTGGMAGRVDPSPFRKSGNGAVSGKFADTVTDIYRTARIKRRKQRKRA